MKKEITVGDLIAINNALFMLANKPFNGLTTYKINKLIAQIKKEAKAFEETRKSIAKKYLKKDQKELIRGSDEELKAFNELKAVRDEKADDFEYEQFPISILAKVNFKDDEGSLLGEILFLFKEDKKK